MPELPEVETVRGGLLPVLEGATFTRVEQRRADLRFPFPVDFAARLEGRCVTALRRRAKYLLAELDSGEVLVMHMGMSGRFIIEEPSTPSSPTAVAQPANKHDHADANRYASTYVHADGNVPALIRSNHDSAPR